MASIKDVPVVVKKIGVMGLAKKTWAEVTKDDVFTWGSALAYAWIFAIFPFLIFTLTLAPYLPGDVKARAMTEINNAAMTGLGPGEGSQMLVNSINEVMTKPQGGLFSVALILALWGASGGMSMTMSALDKAYYVTCERGFIKQRLVAIGLTVATALLILTVLFLLPVGTAIVEYLSKKGSLGTVGVWLVNILRYVVAGALGFVTVSLIYYYGPSIKQKWQAVSPGAIFTVVVAALLAVGFGFYVSNFGSFNKTYGALGGAIILLLFFYLTAVVLLIGAELNSVIDFEVLGVQPGERDFTRKVAAAQGDADAANAAAPGSTKPGSPGNAGAPTGGGGWRPQPAMARDEEGGSAKGAVVKYGAIALAARWAWKRWARAKARKLIKLRTERAKEVRDYIARRRAAVN
ncbi:MAG TPA: YihY/virulence factor BrkB family protein [Tepidisphaeraceae bacterium]|nr:YihY/virulence factor BrkB family protein [Tepidisphaeraceae bacterium]